MKDGCYACARHTGYSALHDCDILADCHCAYDRRGAAFGGQAMGMWVATEGGSGGVCGVGYGVGHARATAGRCCGCGDDDDTAMADANAATALSYFVRDGRVADMHAPHVTGMITHASNSPSPYIDPLMCSGASATVAHLLIRTRWWWW